MPLLFQIIISLWFFVAIKYVLFWVYLWQLKEYHVGRFIDHFRTEKGKKLLFNPWFLIKLAFLAFILMVGSMNLFVLYAPLVVYGAESLLFLTAIARRKYKKPVLTSKTLILVAGCFLMISAYLAVLLRAGLGEIVPGQMFLAPMLLLCDILLGMIVSVLVLCVQPFFVVARNRVLRKARKKMASLNNLTVIGITGSYGKTSTKEFLTTILSSKFRVISTPEHKNSEIGIAQTVLRDVNQNHQIFVVEMGSYNKGGIKLLCDIVRPKIGVVTGVNEQHLATFGSLENLLSAEGGRELAASLPQDGLLVVNGDNAHCLDLYKATSKPKKLYALNNRKLDADLWTETISVLQESVSCIVHSREKELVQINVAVLGGHQVQNLLGAMLAARHLGMAMEEIAMACKNILQKQGGMELKKSAHGIAVIDSSYSANPDGVYADLEYLSVFSQKKVIVMPCLIELGSASEQIHHAIGQKIASICDMAIITTKDQFRALQIGAAAAGFPKEKIVYCQNQQEIFNIITTFCSKGDAVLLEGGRPKELMKLLLL